MKEIKWTYIQPDVKQQPNSSGELLKLVRTL